MDLGPVGIWALPFRTASAEQARDAVVELEELGYGALWVPESGSKVILDVATRLLDATSSLIVASGILNIWMHDPAEVAAAVHDFETAHPGRFLLGLGASHAPLVEAGTDRRYERPYSEMAAFLDGLDGAAHPVAKSGRALAALGPRMLQLSAERSAGAHPYCVPVAYTAEARAVLGPDALLAPELKVVLSTDPDEARAISRAHLEHYFELPNYANNLRRLGYSDADFANGGSDALVDALVAWGTVEDVAVRYEQHREAGADHVCIQVLSPEPSVLAVEAWRELAKVLPV